MTDEISTDHCMIVAKPHPLRSDTVCAEVQAGQTIAQMLGEGASHALEVRVGGELVPRVLWARVRPKAGQFIHVHMYPQGGNAGKFLKLVIVAVIAYFTFGAGAAAAAAWLGVGTTTLEVIGMVAILAVQALIPPPTPKGLNGASGDPFNQLASITGTSNQANPYGVIPCVVGTMRFFPPHAALPYTEISGDDQYLRMLLDLGYGDLDISDIQIGGTPITSYEDVQYEITTTPTLFTQDIYEASVGIPLTDAGNTATRTTQTATTEISLDLIGSNGIFGVDSKGNTVTGTIGFSIQYSPAGAGTWTPIGSASNLTLTGGLTSGGGAAINLTSGARKTYRGGIRWTVPAGQYDVMVTRTTAKGIGFPGAVDTNSVVDQIAWSVLRSISPQNPSTTGTLKLAMRIKASGQLNGVVQNLSVLAAQKVPQWNKATQSWTADAETQNPAWIYAWLLTSCPAVLRRLSDSRLDLDGIADWAAECDAKGLVCSFMMDSARALFDVIRDVLAAGRASFGMRNALYSAVRDVAQTVPVQIFTPANSSGFSYQRVFSDLPHALRVKFTNPEANYQQDEVVAYADGYSKDGGGGTTLATRFEELDLRMVTDPAAAWRLGRYHLGVAYNRPNTYTFNADIENIVCERGDLIHVAHDITSWGADWGRITDVDVTNKTVTLDGEVTLEAGKTYNFRVRRSDGTQVVDSVTSAAGTYKTLALGAALTTADVGNLFVLGDVAHDVAKLVVKQIIPGNDLSAQIVAVDYSDAVLNADSGTPPPFVSSITGQAWCAAPDPPQLNLIVTGAPNDSGAFNQGGGISIPPQGGILRGGGGGGYFHGRTTQQL